MRKRKPADPPPAPRRRKRDQEDPVYVGEHASCLPPPNHLVQLGRDANFPYPLLHAVDPEDSNLAAFVDPRYGYDRLEYTSKPKLPPTWMDPELFVDMARKDPRVRELLQKAFRQNRTRPNLRQLLPLLDEIMDDYITYVLANFAKHRELLARWLLGHYADTQLIKQVREEYRKLRRLGKEKKSPLE